MTATVAKRAKPFLPFVTRTLIDCGVAGDEIRRSPERIVAHVKLLSTESDLLRVSFFVDAGVGRGQRNQRDDVLLVQFMLNKLWNAKFVNGELYGIAGKPPLAIDGTCGTNTIDAIRRFQLVLYSNAEGKHIIQDGVVTPVPPGQFLGARHGRVYTMILLNTNFGHEYGKDRHMKMVNEPGFPPELKSKLYAN